MKIRLGIDIGGSTTKFVACTIENQVIATSQIGFNERNKRIEECIEIFLQEHKQKVDQVAKIVLTGVGSSFIEKDIFQIPTVKVSEFEAIGYGGLYAAKLQKALVISMGTGTALVRASYEKQEHIGGIGLGGGTLCGLGKLLLKEDRLETLSFLAETGSLRNVDLLVGDICCDKIDTLPLTLTASNFGKLEKEISKNDIALGLINMIFQAICKSAMFACRETEIRDIVLTGTLAGMKQTEIIFKALGKFYNLNFIVPKNPVFATAMGAIVAQKNENFDKICRECL